MPDQNEEATVGLDLEGPRVTLDRLIEAAAALLHILQDVDSQTTQRAGGAHDWVVSGLSGGSAHIELTPAPKDERVQFRIRREVVANFARGMAQIAERPEKPAFFTDRALQYARELNALTGETGISAVVIRANGTSVRVTREMAKHVTSIVEGDLKTIGSVEGRLETISIHGQKYFNVYDAVTGRPVRCVFAEALLEQVTKALGKRVMVRGVLHSKRGAEPTSMKVDRLELFPDPSELPTVAMMRGILNNG